jgi:RimJ/RimL family protein N-acetyltransferase
MSAAPPDHPTRVPSHRIETPRLIIRSGLPTDAAAQAALLSAPQNHPFTPPDSGDVADHLRRLERWASKQTEGNFGFMVVTLRDGTFMGFAGFNVFRWGPPFDPASYDVTTALPSSDGDDGKAGEQTGANQGEEGAHEQFKFLEADIGILLDYRHWRQGYAREIIAAQAEYAFNVLGADSISCDTQMENEPWRALMRSMGLGSSETMRPEGRFGDEWFYRFGRPLWQEAKAGMMKKGIWPL